MPLIGDQINSKSNIQSRSSDRRKHLRDRWSNCGKFWSWRRAWAVFGSKQLWNRVGQSSSEGMAGPASQGFGINRNERWWSRWENKGWMILISHPELWHSRRQPLTVWRKTMRFARMFVNFCWRHSKALMLDKFRKHILLWIPLRPFLITSNIISIAVHSLFLSWDNIANKAWQIFAVPSILCKKRRVCAIIWMNYRRDWLSLLRCSAYNLRQFDQNEWWKLHGVLWMCTE